jgi:hypothetical protein
MTTRAKSEWGRGRGREDILVLDQQRRVHFAVRMADPFHYACVVRGLVSCAGLRRRGGRKREGKTRTIVPQSELLPLALAI